MAAHERADACAANSAALAEQLLYPLPEGTHAHIAADREAFDRALKRVHDHFDITEKFPKVGGRELDLYQLYCNVTELGGCAQVIAKKQWRDAAESFKYPDTITSVSYTLRKAYSQLLWDLEQIYFFQARGPRVPPPGAATTPAAPAGNAPSSSNGPSIQPSDGGGRHAASAPKSNGKKRRSDELDPNLFPQLPSGSPLHLTAACTGAGSPDAHAVGAKGTLTLDARFDCGYFVTVHLGRQEFKGMLYYPPTQPAEAPMTSPSGQGVSASSAEGRKQGSGKAKDPSLPKPSRTPFNFFAAEARPSTKAAYPDLPQSDITKKVGEMWQSMAEEGKARYKAMAQADKDRYVGELEAHNYRLAAQAAQQQALSAAQQVASLASQQHPAAAAELPLEPPAASQQLQEAPIEAHVLPEGVQFLPEEHPTSPQLPFFTAPQEITGLGVYPPAPGHLPDMPHQLPSQHMAHLQQQQQPAMMLDSAQQVSNATVRSTSGQIDLPSIIEGWRPT